MFIPEKLKIDGIGRDLSSDDYSYSLSYRDASLIKNKPPPLESYGRPLVVLGRWAFLMGEVRLYVSRRLFGAPACDPERERGESETTGCEPLECRNGTPSTPVGRSYPLYYTHM
jgi:hypothetical protein